jgi:hypothetical protein
LTGRTTHSPSFILLNLRFDNFPVEDDVSPQQSLQSSYLYSLLDFGTFQRIIFGYPQSDNSIPISPDLSNTITTPVSYSDHALVSQITLPISYQTCILSGLKENDRLRFHEKIISSTFLLQIHNDRLCERIFSASHLAEYSEKFLPKVAAPLPDIAPAKQPSPRGTEKGAKKGAKPEPKPAQPSSAAVVSNPLIRPCVEAFNEKDEMIWKWITDGWSESSRILSHGEIRLRLESVLDTSSDILAEFQKTRNHQDNSNLTMIISVSS